MDEDKTKAPFGKVTLYSTSVSVVFSTRNLKFFPPESFKDPVVSVGKYREAEKRK